MKRRFPLSLVVLLALLIVGCNFPAPISAPAANTTQASVSLSPNPTSALSPASTSTPAPTPVPSELVWFAPNMGSTDYAELFTEPDQWTVARSKMDVFKFYTQNVLQDPCAICGDNTVHKFAQAQAFKQLADWGLAIAVEVGAVKPWGCTSDVTFEVTERVIRSVQANGGTVSFLAMDEPRVGGEEIADGLTCGYAMEQSAKVASEYIHQVRAAYPTIIVGDIQAYPHFSVSELKDWIIALENLGTTPAFFHMDIDLERVRTEAAHVGADLQELRRFCAAHGIPFGVIFTSNWREAGSNRAYFDSTMAWVHTVNDAIGKPEHVIFQSWQGPAPSGAHEVPVNLPQNDPENYSHIRLMLEGLAVFGK
jgi:hypothetical protein